MKNGMSKSNIEDVFTHNLMTFVLYDCPGGISHCQVLNRGDEKPNIGDEVDCPVCADLKAARLGELEGIVAAFDLMPGNRLITFKNYYTKRRAELEG